MALLKKTWIILCIAVLSATLSVDALASKYYRYKNKDGVTVVQDHIPPEAVKGGYQILNHLFQVIEEIPPAKTEEQIAQELEQEKKQKALDKLREQQEESDRILMRTYATVDQIVRVRDERVKTVELDVINTQKIIESQQQLIKNLRSKAADRERKGLVVTDETRQEIVKAERMIERSKELLDKKRRDVIAVADEFNAKIKRFNQVTAYSIVGRYNDLDKPHINISSRFLHIPCKTDTCSSIWPALEEQIKQYQSDFDTEMEQFLFSSVETQDTWLVDAVTFNGYESGHHAMVFLRCTVKEESKLLDNVPCQQVEAAQLLNRFQTGVLTATREQEKTSF